MTSCEARSPAGRRSCRNYVKRCLVVMLCCVLVFTMVPPPKAEATAGAATATLVASGAVAAAPVAATVGVLCLAALGISFFQGYYQNDDSIFYGSRSYEVGLEFRDFMEGLDIPEHVASWWNNTVSYFEGKGGVRAGDTFTIPADVAEYARAWAAQKYDFSDGAISFTQDGIVSSDGQFIGFTSVTDDEFYLMTNSSWGFPSPPISCLGTLFVPNTSISLPGYTYQLDSPVTDRFGNTSYDLLGNGIKLSNIAWGPVNFSYVTFIQHKGYLWPIEYYFFGSGEVMLRNRFSDSNPALYSQFFLLSDSILLDFTFSGTDALDVPVVEDVAVKVPALPTDKVGEMEIPIVGELDYTDVLTGEIDKPIDPPIEGEGTMVGDIALEDIAGMEGELGALFISKFPFSIPWDLFRAVKLLAAPPEAPYWEVDFLAPMEHRVGSWKGDTTIVIDMSEYEIVGIVCRWTSMLLFCAALIGATKRLIWTA